MDETQPYPGMVDRIKQARAARVMSQLALAESAGVTPRTMNRIEQAKVTPRPETIRAIAAALDVEPQWLAYGTGRSGLARSQRKRGKAGGPEE